MMKYFECDRERSAMYPIDGCPGELVKYDKQNYVKRLPNECPPNAKWLSTG